MKRKAWKLLPLILTGAFLLCGAGCRGEGQTTTYSPSLPEAQKDDYTLYLEDTFNNNADLSDCQVIGIGTTIAATPRTTLSR